MGSLAVAITTVGLINCYAEHLLAALAFINQSISIMLAPDLLTYSHLVHALRTSLSL